MAISASEPLLLFGGSFDPVHNAHLAAALAASRALGDAPVTFLPNARSPLKDGAHISDAERLALLKLALAPYPQLRLSCWEMDRPAPSYMHASLGHFRAQQDEAPLVLVIGADSLANLHLWQRWQDFAALCHLLVLPRPDAPAADTRVLAAFDEADASQLLTRPAGYRLHLTDPMIDLSSSQVRAQLAAGLRPASLPASVADHIDKHRLYRN